MGRYDLRPLHVHQEATQLLQTRRLRRQPPWYHVVRTVPPTQALVRTLPVQHRDPPKGLATRKPSKMFKPLEIVYPEDRLRRDFFADHPWELARPRMVLEDDGKDWQRHGRSELRQPGKGISGEHVVQRQMWLMNEAKAKAKDMTAAKAYDQARQEFYAIRHEEDVERRVAKEEALATGAYFGKGYLEIGMEQEDKVYEQWKEWAFGEAANQQRGMDSVWTGSGSDEVAVDPDVTETEGGTE